MRLIDADKIEYYPVDRNGKHIGEMVWKPHIDGIETFNLEEHDKQVREDAIDEYKDKMLLRLIPHLNDLEYAKYSETYLAITEIAEQLKENK